MVACLDDSELTSVVRHHHERFDGGGYPTGLAGHQIPLGARVIAVADAFDAMTAVRPYRPATRHKGALDVLRSESGKQFDPAVVRAFLSYYSGRRRWLLLLAALATPAAWRHRTMPVAAAVVVAATPAFLALQGILFPDRDASGRTPIADVPAPVAPGPLVGREPSSDLRVETRQAPTVRHAVRPESAATASVRGPRSQPHHGASPESDLEGGTEPTPPAPVPAANPPAPPAPTPPPPAASPPAPAPPPAPPSSPPPPTSAPTSAPPAPGPPPAPATPTKDQCKKAGYGDYGFTNQGQCISGSNGGGRSRP
jgi:HD domain